MWRKVKPPLYHAVNESEVRAEAAQDEASILKEIEVEHGDDLRRMAELVRIEGVRACACAHPLWGSLGPLVSPWACILLVLGFSFRVDGLGFGS